MSAEANWRRGTRYYWVHKATLACSFIAGSKLAGPVLPLYTERPTEKPEDFHRCELVVVRTKQEAKAMNRKWAERRAKYSAILDNAK